MARRPKASVQRPLAPPARLRRKTPTGAGATPQAQLAGFLARFEPPVVVLARAALARVRALLPPTHELVYDAYNALSVGFSFTERTSEHFLHVAIYPRHLNLGFPFGTSLTDPEGELLGNGSRVRHLTVRSRADLAAPSVARFIREAAALALASCNGPPPTRRRLVVRAVYETQRPRRPSS